jgi:RNA polymerase sigma-70 factor (ECF subfamily)
MRLDPGPASPTAAALQASDDELVRRVRDGEVELFELLVRRHNAHLYRTVRSILRDEAEAEDAMQATYLRAYRFLSGFAGEASFSTWLLRIGVNEALGRRRRRRWLEPVGEVSAVADRAPRPDPRERSPEDLAASREAIALVERAVDGLPEAQRIVFVLREVERLSTDEAAQALGITADAVKVRLHRARRSLRAALAAELGQGVRDAFPFVAPRCDRMVAMVMSRLLGSAA